MATFITYGAKNSNIGLDRYTTKLKTMIDNTDTTSNKITSMTGYSKPQSTSAITTSDTLNEAIGKLECLLGTLSSNL